MTRFALVLAASMIAWPGGVQASPAVESDRGAAAPAVTSDAREAPQRVKGPLARVEAANRAALREPRSDSWLLAAQLYAWAEGAVYRLYAAPGRVSDIALQPGEALVAVAAGDTARWVIGDTTSGSGAARRTHILVKPLSADLATKLVITTDRRVYHIDLRSTATRAMIGIAWNYPQDELLALQRAAAAADAARPLAEGIAVESLNFNYRIDGDRPAWRPIRVFDDGRQVFIELPPNVGTTEAPPLFVVGDGGKAELVNYRLRGRYYVVDRLFGAAELRLGARKQQVVRITRVHTGRQGRGKSS
jgi:type IV secretion system protein VirB9